VGGIGDRRFVGILDLHVVYLLGRDIRGPCDAGTLLPVGFDADTVEDLDDARKANIVRRHVQLRQSLEQMSEDREGREGRLLDREPRDWCALDRELEGGATGHDRRIRTYLVDDVSQESERLKVRSRWFVFPARQAYLTTVPNFATVRLCTPFASA
jgi:hypothetical protein